MSTTAHIFPYGRYATRDGLAALVVKAARRLSTNQDAELHGFAADKSLFQIHSRRSFRFSTWVRSSLLNWKRLGVGIQFNRTLKTDIKLREG